MDIRLKAVQPKAFWGCRRMENKQSLIAIDDYEYVGAVGTGLMIFDNSPHGERKTFMVNNHNPRCLNVSLMVASPDGKFIATVVSMREQDSRSSYMLVYTVEYFRIEYRAPRMFSYTCKDQAIGTQAIDFVCVAFSHDNQFIACGTNIPEIVGVVIYDQKKCSIFQVIVTEMQPYHITFNPLDPTKLCVTGENGLFKFWRVTSKNVHVAPVVGLRGHALNYTHHVWIKPYDDNLVVAGTQNGFLALALGCEQKGHNLPAFGPPQNSRKSVVSTTASNNFELSLLHLRKDEHFITQILLRGDVLLAVSQYNEISAFEIRRVMQSKGVNHQFPSLSPLKKYRLANIEELFGIAWCIQSSVTSFGVVGMSVDSVFQVEVIGDIDSEVTGATVDEIANEIGTANEWVVVTNDSPIFRYHAESIDSLSLSVRTSTVVTNSYTDGTIRVWSYAKPSSFRSSWVVENLKFHPEDNPFHVDVHPMGMLVAFATEGEVREYAVTDDHLEVYRRINIRGPFIGPNGHAHMISQPVSLVKYSNGGQYIAVVTGKMVQVFNLNVLDYDSHSNLGVAGSPTRVMTLTDHVTTVTDIDFSRNDDKIITSSADGSLYFWKFGKNSRNEEHVFKGMSVNRVVLSKNKTKECRIVAAIATHGAAAAGLPSGSSGIAAPSSAGGAAAGAVGAGPSSSFKSKARLVRAISGKSSMGAGLSASADGSNSNNNNNNQQQQQQQQRPHSQQPVAKYFVAVWKDHINTTPQMLEVECEVCSIAVGETDGPDKFDICVLGLKDGRVLVCSFPLPMVQRAVQTFDAGASFVQPAFSTGPTTPSANNLRGALALASGPSKRGQLTFESADAAAAAEATTSSSRPPDGAGTGTGTGTALTAVEGDGGAGAGGSGRGGADDDEDGVTTTSTISSAKDKLDSERCRVLIMHSCAVTRVAISSNGLWIFSAGADGIVHMYATSKRALEMNEMPYIPDSVENQFHYIDSGKLQAFHSNLNDMKRTIGSNKKDYELKVEKMLENKNKVIEELESQMRKEIKQRDESIIHSRNEYLKLKTGMNSEVETIRKQCDESIAGLELAYEQRLSQESSYLEQMKQAYDEYVVHSRIDLEEMQKKAQQQIASVENDRNSALLESEKQKATVLQYFEYVKLRNDELMQGLEQKQAEERCKLKDNLKDTSKQLALAQGHILTGEVQANREISKLKAIIDEKEDDLLKLRSTVDWSQNRILELENGLQKATAELGVRTEMSEKWELKTGEMQQKIIELEKLRKALTTQLHTLRQELGPKEESLMRVTEKLQETDREYELSLQAIAEKEKTLGQKSENLNLLQKQVRELRNATSRKEKVLRRAATLLDEYKFSLEQAYFKTEKRTVVTAAASAGGGAGGGGGETSDTAGNLSTETAAAGGGGGGGGANAGGMEGHNVNSNSSSGARRGSRKPGTASSSNTNNGTANNNNTEVVEIIAQNDGMKAAMKRLSDILTPFLNEEYTDAEIMDELEQVRQEQERHMYLLHNNVNGLRANLDLAHAVAANKVQNHLLDNQNLLKEVNNLRFEVRSLSLENQRLVAQLEFNNRMNHQKKNEARDTGSGLLFPQYQQQHNLLSNQLEGGSTPSVYSGGGDMAAAAPTAGTSLLLQQQQQQAEALLLDANSQLSLAISQNASAGPAAGGGSALQVTASGEVVPSRQSKALKDRGPTKRNPRSTGGGGGGLSKSESQPFFSVRGMPHQDPLAEAARMSLHAATTPHPYPNPAATPQYVLDNNNSVNANNGSLASGTGSRPRTIVGASSASAAGAGAGSLNNSMQSIGGGSSNNNKNEFTRTADDKILALMEMNSQQLKMTPAAAVVAAESNGNSNGALAGTPGRGGGRGNGGGGGGSSSRSSKGPGGGGDGGLELQGGQVPLKGNTTSTSSSSKNNKLPNIPAPRKQQ